MRKCVGYALAIVAALMLGSCFFASILFLMVGVGILPEQEFITPINYFLGTFFLVLCLLDPVAPGRIVRRLEAFAKDIELSQHERTLGTK